nr:MAG TPA: hypothetical protein [Caudoviricetes sp.]
MTVNYTVTVTKFLYFMSKNAKCYSLHLMVFMI